MADELAPPVVAVVSTYDPGPWLEDCLRSLVLQDYPGLAVLVVDAASPEPVARRVAAVAPELYLQRLALNRGFGPSVNEGLQAVEGAAFYLVCHDDVVLEPDALRRMVEESFRSNAAIVGPKLVAIGEPDRILQLGLDVDRLGAPVRRVERREFDQSQHDEAREVFAVPGACKLVRADLFRALGGFDEQISMFGEDVDLCWRAHLAGARIVVAPRARAAHREATSSRQRLLPEARALQWRHELRAVLKNYGPARLAVALFVLVVLSVLEVGYFSLAGKRRRARLVLGAWRWNLQRERHLGAARREVATLRRESDRAISQLFSRRGTRAWRFLKSSLELSVHEAKRERLGRARSLPADVGLTGSGPAGAGLVGAGRRETEVRISRRQVLVPLGIAALVVVFGSRSLLVGHLPLVGQLLPAPGPTRLIADFLGGWRDQGSQAPGPSSPAFGLLGLAGLLFLGATSELLKVAAFACIPLGAWGASRLAARAGGGTARLGAGLAYLCLPLAWNDLGTGDLQALVGYVGLPFVLARLLDATTGTSRGHGRQRSWRGVIPWSRIAPEVLGLGLLLALVGSFAPLVVVIALAAAVALALGSAVAGDTRGGLRAVGIGLAGSVVAVVLTMPWSITFFQPGARLSVLIGAAPSASAAPSLATLIRFEVGPIGHGLLGYSLLACSMLVLLVGRGQRFSSAARLFVIALAGWSIAWAASRGWLGAGGGSLALVLSLPAACIAVTAGLSLEALLVDLPRRGFGWRQLAGAAFCVTATAALVPVLVASGTGRWGLPTTGYDTVLSWLDTSPPSAAAPVSGAGAPTAAAGGTSAGGTSAGRSAARMAVAREVLWVGDPRALPLASWQVSPGLAAGVSSKGLPNLTGLWPSASPGADEAVLAGITSAERGLTVRLGQVLALHGISYVVVPSASAPVLAGVQSPEQAPPPAMLLAGLASQQDLHQLPSEGGIYVFEVTERPVSAATVALDQGGGTPAALRGLAVALELVLVVGTAGYLGRSRGSRRSRRSRPASAGAHSSGRAGPASGEQAEVPDAADAERAGAPKHVGVPSGVVR